MNSADSRRLNEHNLKIAQETINVASEIGKSPAQVAINWVRQKSANLIPIIGARTVNQLNDNLAALEFTLSDEHMRRLNSISQVDLGFPHQFLSTDFIKDILYAGTYEKIEKTERPGKTVEEMMTAAAIH